MHFWFRFVIVWCIALALPAQGLASATMAHCGPSHERSRVALGSPEHHRSADAGSDHQAMAVDAAALAGPGADDAAAAQAHATSDKFTDLAQYKCSACASCCAAAALPSVMPRVPQPACTPVVFAQTTVTVVACATGGPDRPPRTLA